MDDDARNAYTGPDVIEVLKGIDAVRKLPGMYIGNVHDGGALMYVVIELVAQAVDAHLVGRCARADVTLCRDGAVEVRCDADGTLFDDPGDLAHPGQRALSDLERMYHARWRWPRFHYGLWNHVLAVVNAVSAPMTVGFTRQGHRWHITYARGVHVETETEVSDGRCSDVAMRFTPDPTIFSRTDFDADMIRALLHELSFLVCGMDFSFCDERRGDERRRFCARGGVADYVLHLGSGEPAPFVDPIVLRDELADAEGPWMRVEIAFQWRASSTARVLGCTNGVINEEGGTHVAGLRRGLRECLRAYARELGALSGDRDLSADAACTGVTAVVSLWHCAAQFGTAQWAKLASPEADPFVADTVRRGLWRWLRAHPVEAQTIIAHVIEHSAR
jgi:DNA gyrase subunit B